MAIARLTFKKAAWTGFGKPGDGGDKSIPTQTLKDRDCADDYLLKLPNVHRGVKRGARWASEFRMKVFFEYDWVEVLVALKALTSSPDCEPSRFVNAG